MSTDGVTWHVAITDTFGSVPQSNCAETREFMLNGPTEMKFVKFEVITYHKNGAALQYFTPVIYKHPGNNGNIQMKHCQAYKLLSCSKFLIRIMHASL